MLKSVIGSTIAFLGLASFIPAIATAPAPPQLTQSKLNGKPISVLSVTRSSDKVLVRCYPTQEPKLEVTTRTDGVREGLLTCVNPQTP
jgi:hypothetical protein